MILVAEHDVCPPEFGVSELGDDDGHEHALYYETCHYLQEYQQESRVASIGHVVRPIPDTDQAPLHVMFITLITS